MKPAMTVRSRIFASSILIASLGVAFAATQWTMEPTDSSLAFVGTQAGARFEGAFEKFTADIRFDPQDLATSRFDVRIETASVNTRDSERDDIIKGPDLFDSKQFPTAHYVAEQFTDKGAGKFSATGQLTLRGVSRPVPIDFTFESQDGRSWLKGTAALQRLDFGVGQGEWQDTESVANEVQIRFALLLKQ
jgi:polyisoprenoid-binding protein YceI